MEVGNDPALSSNSGYWAVRGSRSIRFLASNRGVFVDRSGGFRFVISRNPKVNLTSESSGRLVSLRAGLRRSR